MQIRTAAIATLGCKLNQSESDEMARQLDEAGVAIVPFGHAADLFIINSCTVTHVGDRKSRHLVRQAVRANPSAYVAVTGCYAELEPKTIEAIEGVSAIIGNAGKGKLLDALRERGLCFGVTDGESERVSEETSLPFSRSLAPSITRSLTAKTRAFVKIQEGCDNNCSYCIVPQARGEGHSLSTEAIVKEIRRRVDEGYQEVVLTGVNITAFDRDRGTASAVDAARGMGLVRLLEAILELTTIPRIRLSSLQPEDWNSGYYPLFDTGRLCRQLHLSLQSGSDAVLRRMRRRYNSRQYREIVEAARQEIPGVAITTDVIAGFPGETEEEHEESEQFLRSIGFAGLHVFKYSPRTGTPAATMPEQVPAQVKQDRSERLIGLADAMGREFRAGFAGTVLSVLWEEPLSRGDAQNLGLEQSGGRIMWSGLSDNYIRVYARGPEGLHGTIGGAIIGPVVGDGVLGTLVRT